MLFMTESGSTYQLDVGGKRIRRLEGTTPLTRVGPHGEWREFLEISSVKIGESVTVLWKIDRVDPQKSIAQMTLTSPVTAISAEGRA